MNRLQHYLSMIIFTASFALGVQIPNFVDQYGKRVDAHLIEASNMFAGYQALADVQQGGDVNALILKHETSDDLTFRAEAMLIRNLRSNIGQYRAEIIALNQSLWQGISHIVLNGSPSLRQETIENYSVNLPLNLDALTYGFVVAILLCVIWEFLLMILGVSFGIRGRRRRAHQQKSQAAQSYRR